MPGQYGEGIADVITMPASQEKWIEGHPYLAGPARFQRMIDDAIRDERVVVPAPHWENFAQDFGKGIPLLSARPLDKEVIAGAGMLLMRLVESLSEADCPEQVKQACAFLRDEFQRSPDAPALLLERVVSGKEEARELVSPEHAGLVRYLSWTALERVLRTWAESLSSSRDKIPCGRPYCPLCGSLPSMAQLVRTNKGRERFLSCGCCRSKWSYQRTGCPFCGNDDQDRQEILEPEQEKDFRIDVCHECNGYLKTYTREGDEQLLLADWSTMHLDVLAGLQGLQRRANSLYEL